ncbi:MAG TPA: hypothetical protein VHH36_09335 [Candidatus Thermoplasmatota archaeon]|nr:hypothetical protein [Candidatus Thermoplasmatota archaeon]
MELAQKAAFGVLGVLVTGGIAWYFASLKDERDAVAALDASIESRLERLTEDWRLARDWVATQTVNKSRYEPIVEEAWRLRNEAVSLWDDRRYEAAEAKIDEATGLLAQVPVWQSSAPAASTPGPAAAAVVAALAGAALAWRRRRVPPAG